MAGILSVLALLSLSSQVQANVNSVTASPARVAVPAKGAATFSVNWVVNRTEPTISGTVTVSSANAQLRVNGVTIATLGQTLSRPSTLAITQSASLSFNEVITLNPAQARRVSDAPAGAVTITRTFTDTQTTGLGTLRVFAGPGIGGSLNIRRIDLHFENDARTDVVRKDESIRAIAELNFRSSGLLRGEWRIIDPTASLGSARGRVLQVVRQQLASSGEGRTRIVSPPLPTRANGLYLVTFVVADTDRTIETPILRYFVLEGTVEAPQENLTILTPGEGTAVSTATVFSWKPLSGATAYQLEIFDPGQSIPVSGKLVPGTDLTLSLSTLSLENLDPGKRYDWRVRAFDREGRVVGLSPRQSLMMP
ncbi:hypothetical protein O4H49_03900 [Kiloniella laminariae]|uniref:Fibronectin type-III domain-containing protein n=1 Tax=Kiloniella laminariae TaxID=454162 RepID=A0ABT4LFN8_9PROT|nr:hypothetical protein [Kiloniella laminariae]MCZ4279907.1 hypothetical protein [Kiloniella laminariae]